MLPSKLLWYCIECSLQCFCNIWLGVPYMLNCVTEKPCREAHQVGYVRCTRTALEVQTSDLLDNISIAAKTEVHLFQLKTPLCPRLIKSSCCNSVFSVALTYSILYITAGSWSDTLHRNTIGHIISWKLTSSQYCILQLRKSSLKHRNKPRVIVCFFCFLFPFLLETQGGEASSSNEIILLRLLIRNVAGGKHNF